NPRKKSPPSAKRLAEPRPPSGRRLRDRPELDVHVTPDRSRCFDQRVELDSDVGGIEHSIELRATGAHALRHLRFRQPLARHPFLEELGDHALDSGCLHRFVDVLFPEEVIERGATMLIHVLSPATLASASGRFRALRSASYGFS